MDRYYCHKVLNHAMALMRY